jgi:hypothetical protein
MKPKTNKKLAHPEVRVRYEPPTLEEAVFAAQGLCSDIEDQVAIACALTGLVEADVRRVAQRMVHPTPSSTTISAMSLRRPVVVERRSPRPLRGMGR